MRQWLISCLAAGLACVSAAAGEAAPQSDRRDRLAPELVVESGGRRGACDVLTFTRDGRHLLAAGDDKVVRVWEWKDGRAVAESKVLRWSVWGEKRGAIYALAVSPDVEGKRVAVGGLGVKNTAAAVIDRLSGEVLHTVYAVDEKLRFGSVRAITFSPRGDRVAFGSADGSVWLWRPESKEENWLTRLGQHVPIQGAEFNFIRLVRFLDEDHLLSVAESGEVLRWDLTAGKPIRHRIRLFDDLKTPLFSVVLSDDGEWLAATAKKKPILAVRSLDGKERKDIPLAAGSVAVSVAFDAGATRLAVGIRPLRTNANGFYLEDNEQIRLYDLGKDKPALRDGPRHSWRIDSLVFHPDGEHLGVAGGDNHEVTIWDLNNLKEPTSVLRGVGTGLWDVALSKDGRSLAFRTRRKSNPTHPNQRGQGPWTVFDLEEREFHPEATTFVPLHQLQEQDGWRIAPDPDSYVWWIVHDGANIKHRLPLDKKRYERPTCYAFLPRVEGRPVRVAVGHYNGVSVYDVTAEGVRRSWLGLGHEGEVMALAVSADGNWLVSASNDQTISAWSLRARPSGSELGARFRAEGGRVFVAKVDAHGSAWEAGLKAGDEIAALAIDRRVEFSRLEAKPAKGSVEGCLKKLAMAEPGQVLDFSIRRPGHEKPIASFTSVQRRPLWRFFPTRDKEWVLWMWGYCYYDTSTNGDHYIGWQLNNAVDMRKTPAFYRAKQFHERFHRQDILDVLLQERDVGKTLETAQVPREPPNFGVFDSVRVRIEPRDQQVKDKDLEVVLDIEPRIYHPDYVPVRAELWVNDRRLQVWPLHGKLNGKPWRTTWTIPREQLRVGDNDLTLQCYNEVEGRGQGWLEASARVVCERRANLPKLHALAIGLNDYSRSALGKNGVPVLHDLTTPRRDAEAMRDAWLAQKHLFYDDVQVDLLPEGSEPVGRATILKKLEQLANRAGPDDRVFVFLAGHGETLQQGDRKHFVFCCPDFDEKRLDKTSISARDLYEALAKIPGRKVVFLDACRSGHVAGQPARDLTPGGLGPIILAACDRGESSYEIKGAPHAVFATAILEAMGEQFARADQNGDGRLDARELYEYTARRVPELLKEAHVGVVQTPARSPAQLARYPLLAGKPLAEK